MGIVIFIIGLLIAGAIVGLLGALAQHQIRWEDFNYGGTDDDD